jgi:hypothetical protein
MVFEGFHFHNFLAAIAFDIQFVVRLQEVFTHESDLALPAFTGAGSA